MPRKKTPPMTPAQYTMRARIAAQARWSRESGADQAKRGQEGLLARFERDVDPDGVLDPVERRRRAESARKAHMSRLALKSSRARTAKSINVDAPDIDHGGESDAA